MMILKLILVMKLHYYDTTYFSQEYSDSIETASLQFSAGAGGFKMLTPTDKLIDFRTEGAENNYRT